MKSCKSTLRKAAMAAMLAGAITTTGGVKADEYREDSGYLRQGSELASRLTEAIIGAKLTEIDSILKKANIDELKILISGLAPREGYYRKNSTVGLLDAKINSEYSVKRFLSQSIVKELKDRITSEANLKEEVIQLKADIEREKLTSKELSTKLEEVTSDRDKALSESVELANKLSVA